MVRKAFCVITQRSSLKSNFPREFRTRIYMPIHSSTLRTGLPCLTGRLCTRFAIFAVCWIAIRLIATENPALVTERIFGPETSTGPYKHPASFTELDNGDLYLVFFSGKGEYRDNSAAVFGSRLKQGGHHWSAPVAIARNPFHSLGNAVVWQAPDGLVWLFYVTRYGETWSRSRISAKISRDRARTWSEPFQVTFDPGTMVRSRPIALADGHCLLPVYREYGEDTEVDSVENASFFLRYDSAKRSWIGSNPVHSRLGNIQPAVVELDPGRLVAYCRRGGDYKGRPDGWMVRTESTDGGRTWTPGVDAPFPNPNAAVDFIALQSKACLLVYNDSFTHRTPLTVALSVDGAATFPWRRNLAESPEGDYGYPTAIQTRDGRIQVLYTSDERSVIRRAIFRESWVRHVVKSPDGH
ncbi:MAG: hypothetical protein EXS36_12340 [Pedosphaera sp.]|nr:hypothetical protein [Pedosphaera sp.]